MSYKLVAFTKRFEKEFKKLDDRQKAVFYLKLALWMDNPHDKSLRDHALKGKYIGYRSVDITYDLRALYYTKGDVEVIFGFIGTHSQLYG